ncbi:ribosome maturation factor RimM [Shouchella sp. JSM 1781072]|uniref:ribosome maturation factor RimM n=1 Tax=Bacillaceae TaxID=186817 RepID=UPI0020D08220|nr:ribosome maturation factor RimM [Alkalihalobacillus sp. LMS6]UTR04793.1 ribosome maturation factor RimM [Alkalihalobacillus sp. LMS6]
MTQWFNVGRLVNTHGVRGEVRVLANTDFGEERFAIGSQLKVAGRPEEKGTMLQVASHRKHKTFDLLTFEGYTNINEVEGFKGNYLYVSEKLLSELEEHEFYYHEIIGCRVTDEEGNDLGTITDIIETGANDVWVVQRSGKKDLLLPYIEQVIKEVDLEASVVKVHVMEGLDD